MRKPHALMVVLATLTVVSDIIAYRVWLADMHARLSQLVIESLLCSQIGLLWIWAWMGATRASIRFSAAMIGTISVVGILSLPRSNAVWFFQTELLAMVGGISLLVGALRLSEGRLALANEEVIGGSRRSLQFSLRSLMEFSTGFAIVLALTRIIYSPIGDWYYYFARAWSWIAMLGLSFAIVTALAVWVVFSRVPAVVGCTVLLFAACLLTEMLGGRKGWIEVFGANVDAKPAREIPLQAALVVASLSIFRIRGYRVVRLKSRPIAAPR
jgi:hypothetical protein